jgi:hypothetical protein
MSINESLHAKDLRELVKKVFEIDCYQSKIGNDKDVIVLSFTVDHEDPANDLENFVEMGYDFVLDADVSPGETEDGTYKVFVELERNSRAPANILELLNGIELLTGMSDMRFRYFKNFKSKDATLRNLKSAIPTDTAAYEEKTKQHGLDNFSTFFKESFSEVDIVNESLRFKTPYSDTITFDIITSGPKSEVYNSIQGPIIIEGSAIAEVMYFTKRIGNYNITKVGNTFIFENSGWAVALEKK